MELKDPHKAQMQATIGGVGGAADASEECACQRGVYAESGLVDWKGVDVKGAFLQENL